MKFFMVSDVTFDFFLNRKFSNQNPASKKFLLFTMYLLSIRETRKNVNIYENECLSTAQSDSV